MTYCLCDLKPAQCTLPCSNRHDSAVPDIMSCDNVILTSLVHGLSQKLSKPCSTNTLNLDVLLCLRLCVALRVRCLYRIRSHRTHLQVSQHHLSLQVPRHLPHLAAMIYLWLISKPCGTQLYAVHWCVSPSYIAVSM